MGPLVHGVAKLRDVAMTQADLVHTAVTAFEEMKEHLGGKMAVLRQELQAQIDDLVAGRELEREQLRQQLREEVIAEIRNEFEEMVENGDFQRMMMMLIGGGNGNGGLAG